MSRNTPGVLTKINVPRALLWLAGLVVTAVGYVVMTSSNIAQAEFAASGSQDYANYFTAQSGSTLGSILIGAGILGLLLALATHAVTRAAASAAGMTGAESPEDSFDDDDELDLSDEGLDADDASHADETAGIDGAAGAPREPAATTESAQTITR